MNASCPVETSPSPPSLFQNGNLVFQAHHVGWIVASFFTAIAVVTSFWLVNKHLQWYTNKREQRQIVRLLFMVPIYAMISLASYLFWNHATPLLLIRDAYESTVLTAFFYLLLTYLSPNPEDQRTIFRKVGLSRAADAQARAKGEEPKKWMFPLGFIKSKPADGLYFLQMMKWGVLQYCVIRPTTTLAAVTLNYIGWYCDGSWSPRWGYVYITVIVSVSVSIAMYCLIQLYMPIAVYLAPHKPLLKLFSVKAVVFLTFWQATFLSALSLFGVVKDTTYMTADDINIGIAALLETFEMMLFAFLHLKAFSYKPYRPFHDPRSKAPPPIPTPRLRSLGHAFDFRETFREIRVGWIYILDKMHGREPKPDIGARRIAHFESAFERPRPSNLPTSKALDENGQNDVEKGLLSPSGTPREYVEHTPWLRLPDYRRREKSEGLEVQIQNELELRGYGSNIPGRGHIGPPPNVDSAPGHKTQRSWWRSMYSRVSQSANEAEDEEQLTCKPSRRRKSESKTRQRSRDIEADRRLLVEHDFDFEDPPPQPVFTSHQRRERRQQKPAPQEEHLDTLAPLSVFATHNGSHQARPPKQHSSGKLTTSHSTLPNNPNPSMTYSRPLPPALSSQTSLASSDSLFGRMFPPSANSSSANHAPGSDSDRSLPSVSTHGVSPLRATPRGRLVLTTPQILGKAEQRIARITPTPQEAITAYSVEALPSNELVPVAQFNESMLQGRETGWTPDDHPALTSPLSAEFAGHEFSAPLQKPTRRNDPAFRSPSPGLRRKSTQLFSPDSQSRRDRRQSVDVSPPQIPATSYSGPSSHGNREARGQANPLEELRRSGYLVEDIRSDITQPSLSGTPRAVKYPTIFSSTLVMPVRLAPGTPHLQSRNYSPGEAGPSTESAPRTQRPQSRERSSRSKDYIKTRTTRP